MDAVRIATIVSALSASRTADAVQMAVLKKALDSQALGAMALINALPPVNPPHLGRVIDTFA
jgi:Putative motility protein